MGTERGILTKVVSATLITLVLLVSNICSAEADLVYVDDLSQVCSSSGPLGCYFNTFSPHAIGDLGEITNVIDLRGFVPMSLPPHVTAQSLLSGLTRILATRKALLILYFGDLKVWDVATDTSSLEAKHFKGATFIHEDDVSGHDASWVRLAYGLTRSKASDLYDNVVGGAFDSVEPTTIFFTRHSSFILLDYRYSNIFLHNYGQVLLVLEFAKKSGQYKAIYDVFSTTYFTKSTRTVLEKTAPFVMHEVISAGVQAVAPH